MHFFKNKSAQALLNELSMAHAELIEVQYLVGQRHPLENTLRKQILTLEERIRNIKSPQKASNPSHSKIHAAIKECQYMVNKLYKFNESQNAAQKKLKLSATDFAINDAKLDRANTGKFPNPIMVPRRM